jgi:hypothetical protein
MSENPQSGWRAVVVGLGRPVFLVALYAAMVLAGGAVVRRWLPFPPVPQVQPKVAWLAEHGDDYDTLMVGSSRTLRHIIPKLFDELMAAGGQPTHSFNLGLDGIRPPEDSFVLEAVLASRHRPLKYVIVEGNDLRVNAEGEARDTMRSSYWYDLKRCGVVLRATLWHTSYDETTWFGIWSDRFAGIDNFLGHVRPALSRAVNLGRGHELFPGFHTADDAHELSQKALGQNHDGYVYGRDDEPISKANLKKLQAGVAERLKEPAQPFFSDVESQRVLQEKRRVIEAHGGRMIMFHPPMTQAETFYPDPQLGPVPLVIDLTDPRLYPELFEARYRKDHAHLNPAGAEIFTRLLVGKILENQKP